MYVCIFNYYLYLFIWIELIFICYEFVIKM